MKLENNFSLFLQKKFICVRKLLLILDVVTSYTLVHVHVITAWCLIDFSKMKDNENLLFEILLLTSKFSKVSMKIPFCCRSYSSKEKDFHVTGPNTRTLCQLKLEPSFHSLSRSL